VIFSKLGLLSVPYGLPKFTCASRTYSPVGTEGKEEVAGFAVVAPWFSWVWRLVIRTVAPTYLVSSQVLRFGKVDLLQNKGSLRFVLQFFVIGEVWARVDPCTFATGAVGRAEKFISI
jgi:hypothetical protein